MTIRTVAECDQCHRQVDHNPLNIGIVLKDWLTIYQGMPPVNADTCKTLCSWACVAAMAKERAE